MAVNHNHTNNGINVPANDYPIYQELRYRLWNHNYDLHIAFNRNY